MAPKRVNAGATAPDEPLAAPGRPAAATAGANVIVLAEDVTLLELLKHALDGRQRVWRADNALHAADLLVAAHSGILFIDAALPAHETPTLVDKLHEQFPDFPIVVTGRRDDELELGDRISSGAVFRFLHKPVSADRVRNFMDAAARRQGEQPDTDLSASSALPVASARALDSVRSIRLPRIRLDPVVIKRALRILVAIAFVVVAVWALTSLVRQKPWEKISIPDITALAPAQKDEPAPIPTRTDPALSRLLSAAGIALSQGRLAEPEGQNAVELYRRALLADPGNAEALRGLARTTDELLLRVEQLLLAQDLPAAAGALDAARSADPANPRLEFFSAQLVHERDRLQGASGVAATGGAAAEQAQDERLNRLLTLADERMRQGRLVGDADSAKSYVLEARDVRPGDAGVQQAMNALSSRMLLAANEAMKDGDAVAATGWLDRAASLGVDGRSVARLRAEIESARLATVQEDRSRLLALANQRIAQGRLLDPPGDSARHYVDLLSAADPGYSGLAETATLLAAALLDDSGRLMRDGRYADAEAALAAAGSAGASKSEVASARSALNSARARAVASQEILPEGALTKIEHQPAKYPVRAASRGIEGWVDVQFTVAADGSTQDAVVTDSSPAGSFEQAVLDAVQGWRYQPRIVAGKPLDQRVQLRVRFELAGN